MGINLIDFGKADTAGKDIVNQASTDVASLLDQVDAILTKQREALFADLAKFRDDTVNAVDQKIEAKIATLTNLKIGLSL